MSRRNSILGAFVLCVLALSAFGVANAAAKGLTATVCEKVGPEKGAYTESHCEKEGKGEFETVEIAPETTTEVKATSTVEPTLGITIGGVPFHIVCKKMASTSGDVKNIVEGGVMKAHGTNIVLSYGECKGTLVNAPEKTCTVNSPGAAAGTINTNVLTSITEIVGEEHHVKFKPETAGQPFATITIGSGCAKAFEGTKEVTGSATGVVPNNPDSHITFSGKVGLFLGAIEAEYNDTTHAVMLGTENTIGLKTTES